MSVDRTKISALAIVYNEEHNIREYLQNMSFADEIVVVDSYSDDATPNIIQQEFPHVRFYQRKFDDFSSQRNYTIDLATNDWIIFFDADERVSDKGTKEIIKTLNSQPEEVAFWVKRIFYYEGRPLVNSKFNEDKAIRIFRKSKCRYSDKLVHEKLDIDGKTNILKHAIHHYSFKNKEDFLNKRLQYSKLKAKELYKQGVKPNVFHYTVRPAFRFFKYYVIGFGFLNGKRGREIARILGYHVYMRYVYLKEMSNASETPKILVIQQKMIGDVLASSIICNNLKKIYPKSTVDYSIYPFTAPVVENNPNIDNLILFDTELRKNKRAFLNFLISRQKKEYDIVIDAYGILESNLIVAFSNAKQKIGFYKPYTSFVYTDTVKELKKPLTKAGLALDNRLQLLRVLNKETVFDCRPKIFMTPEEILNGKKILRENGIEEGAKVYMISLLGSSNIKTYPLEYMAELLNVITAETNAWLVFNYIPFQKEEADAVYNLCNSKTKDRVIRNITPGNIREFLSVLYHCNALIGNEGGAVNMAKAINVPTFTIFSTWIKKVAWNSFDDNEKMVSVHLKDYKPELYGKKSPKEMKGQALQLYQQFTADLIIPALKKYLKKN